MDLLSSSSTSTSAPRKPTFGRFIRRPEKMPDDTESHLLNLPPELRENIWKLVLGLEGKTIHLYRHEYKEGLNESASLPALYLDSTGKQYDVKPSCCRKDTEWDDAYALSKLPENFSPDTRDRRGRLKTDSKGVLNSYNARHRHCRQPDVRCGDVGEDHTPQCRCSRVPLGVECISTKNPHPDLSLLRVCRSIYFEAAHLPYKNNTFSFPNEENLAFFAKEVLRPWQREIIQRIEVVTKPPIAQKPAGEQSVDLESSKPDNEPEQPFTSPTDSELPIESLTFTSGIEASLALFPSLTHLRLSIPYVKDPYMRKLSIPQIGQSPPLPLPFIRKVEVICGADTDMFLEYENDSREERRELASYVEKFLMGECCGEAYDRSLAWWRFLLSNGRAVTERGYLARGWKAS